MSATSQTNTRCARCGELSASMPRLNIHKRYEYCDACQEEFQRAHDNGVIVRSRHANDGFEEWPYAIRLGKQVDHKRVAKPPNRAESQVEALRIAKDHMERFDIPGVFLYSDTGSVWLIDEYLDAHPSIADDVETEPSLLRRLFR